MKTFQMFLDKVNNLEKKKKKEDLQNVEVRNQVLIFITAAKKR